MNLDNLNLVELTDKEIDETEGGIWIAVALAVIYVASTVYGLANGTRYNGQP
jgi:lactobin A/cerein 7B family class IIb bacteriocin